MSEVRALRSSLIVLLLILLLFLAALRLTPAEQQFMRGIESMPEAPPQPFTQQTQPASAEIGTADQADACTELGTTVP